MRIRRASAFVLLYHRVLPVESALGVSCRVFEEHLDFLKSSGHVFMDSAMLGDFLAGRLDEASKHVLLSFDDGWADNLFFATPILGKYSAKAMIAICGSLVNPSPEAREISRFIVRDDKASLDAAANGGDFSQFLSWGELSLMRESGLWDFASHGCSHLGNYFSLDNIRGFHPRQTHWTMKYALGGELFDGAPRAEFKSVLSFPRTRLAPKLVEALKKAEDDGERIKICSAFPNPIERMESDEEFRSRVGADLSESRKIIGEKLGVVPDCLVWPWGDYSEESERIAVGSGFRKLFTVEKGFLAPGSNPLRIPRIVAPNSLSGLKRRIRHGIYSMFPF